MGLNDLIDTEAARRAEYGRRKKYHTEKTIHPKLREEHEGEGWIHVKDLQSGAKMRKAKSLDELLENRLWCILYQLGYPLMNAGRKFEIEITKGDKPVTKQVDVFAKDDETVIVLECKACEEMQDRDLRKDISELASLQKPIANAIRQHFGKDFKPKILWAFATWNVIWRKTDLALAEANSIAVIKDREIRYLEEISRSLRGAGRYQFHAEFFKDQKIPELDGKHVPAIATKLGGHKAFIFCATPADLLKISFVNHRDLRDPGGAPAYQRLLKNTYHNSQWQHCRSRHHFARYGCSTNPRISPAYVFAGHSPLSRIEINSLAMRDVLAPPEANFSPRGPQGRETGGGGGAGGKDSDIYISFEA